MTIALLALGVALLTAALVPPYRAWWRRFDRAGRTATGFGALLGPVVLLASLLVPAPLSLRACLAFMTLATLVFWWDDLVEVRARIRVAVAIAAGMAFAAMFPLDPGATVVPAAVAVEALLAGLVSVCVVNMVNFYDGADLNLATFILLTAGLLLAFASPGTPWAMLAAAAGAFAIGFAIWNRLPRTVYLGDGGSFAFAGLLTILGLFFLRQGSGVPPEAAIPAALPALDTAYVFWTRVREKHDLLSRNYLHLYQKLDARYPRFIYLLPQIGNVALSLGAARLVEAAGVARTPAVIGATAVTTILFYTACRRAFVPREPA